VRLRLAEAADGKVRYIAPPKDLAKLRGRRQTTITPTGYQKPTRAL
jgi:hypothetical protein